MHDYKKKLTDYLCSNRFDVVVALSGLQYYFLHSIKDGSVKIAWFHFSFDISRHLHGRKKLPFLDLLVSLHTKRRVWHTKKYKTVVVVSKWQEKIWRQYCDNVMCIYNPLPFAGEKRAMLTVPKAIAVGSLTYEKGYDRLIDAWWYVHQKYPHWQLDIFGGGELKNDLQRQIDEKELSGMVTLKGVSDNIKEEYLHHSIFIHASRTESLPIVLAEASLCGLPLIAINCNSSISEILQDGINGLLVNTDCDALQFSEKICILIEKTSMREKLGGSNSLNTSQTFALNHIVTQWQLVLDTDR